MSKDLIEVKNLKKTFSRGFMHKTRIKAVDKVSLKLNRGETLALVGPSGCGKTTIGRLILGLIKPDSGQIYHNETDIFSLTYEELCRYRLKVQLVGQHPDTALNPQYKLYRSISEPLRIHKLCDKKDEPELVERMISGVGLHPEILNRYPHEVSGGQIQRAVIARALFLNPEMMVIDEPTSMLDISVQAQVIHLLKTKQKEFNLGYLFITHDLDLAASVSDRIIIMNKGKIIESGLTPDVLASPGSPFTESLIEAFNLSHPGETSNVDKKYQKN